MICDYQILYVMADLRHGIAGGIAGIAVDCFFYPLQTIKTRIMGSSLSQNLTNIALSKFRGFSCQMLVSFPYSFTFFYTYETTRAYLQNIRGKDVIASALAEVTGNLVRNPFQIVKQQLMTGRSHQIAESLADILKTKGVKGLYIGLKATLARDIMFSSIQLPLFEIFREKNPLDLSPVISASVSGAIAAVIAGFCSCPLDVIKTRLMTQDFKINNAQQMVKSIYKDFGLRGFFRGVGFRCGILSLGGIVYFGALQKARIYLQIQNIMMKA